MRLKRLILAGVLVAGPAWGQAMSNYAAPDLPPVLNNTYNIPGTLMLIAGAAQACQLRPPEWTADLISVALVGANHLLKQDFPGDDDTKPGPTQIAMKYLAKSLVAGETFTPPACQTLPNTPYLGIGDQAVAHGFGGGGQ